MVKFHEYVFEFASNLSLKEMQDVHEFLRKFLDAMHEDFNRITVDPNHLKIVLPEKVLEALSFKNQSIVKWNELAHTSSSIVSGKCSLRLISRYIPWAV
jgi:ubiquitin C-terminal hydrolase